MPKTPVTPLPTDDTSTPTTTVDTSSWKTYTNEEYGFSFRYPGGVIVEPAIYVDVSSGGVGTAALSTILISSDLPSGLVMSVTTSSLDSIFARIKKITISPDLVGKNTRKIDFPAPGIRGSDPADIGLIDVYYYFSLDKGKYLYVSHIEEPSKLYEKIISTIRIFAS